jgi:hypothetical protein
VGEIAPIGEEHRQLHQVGCRAAGRPQRHFEVGEYLGCLCAKIILADHVAVMVEGGLAGNENDAAGANIDDLGVTGRCAEFGRIDPDDRRRVARHLGRLHWRVALNRP